MSEYAGKRKGARKPGKAVRDHEAAAIARGRCPKCRMTIRYAGSSPLAECSNRACDWSKELDGKPIHDAGLEAEDICPKCGILLKYGGGSECSSRACNRSRRLDATLGGTRLNEGLEAEISPGLPIGGVCESCGGPFGPNHKCPPAEEPHNSIKCGSCGRLLHKGLCRTVGCIKFVCGEDVEKPETFICPGCGQPEEDGLCRTVDCGAEEIIKSEAPHPAKKLPFLCNECNTPYDYGQDCPKCHPVPPLPKGSPAVIFNITFNGVRKSETATLVCPEYGEEGVPFERVEKEIDKTMAKGVYVMQKDRVVYIPGHMIREISIQHAWKADINPDSSEGSGDVTPSTDLGAKKARKS